MHICPNFLSSFLFPSLLSFFHSPSCQWWPDSHFRSWGQRSNVPGWSWRSRSWSAPVPLPKPPHFTALGEERRHGSGRHPKGFSASWRQRRKPRLVLHLPLLKPRLLLLIRRSLATPSGRSYGWVTPTPSCCTWGESEGRKKEDKQDSPFQPKPSLNPSISLLCSLSHYVFECQKYREMSRREQG